MWKTLSIGPFHSDGRIRLAVVKKEPDRKRGPKSFKISSRQGPEGVEKLLGGFQQESDLIRFTLGRSI